MSASPWEMAQRQAEQTDAAIARLDAAPPHSTDAEQATLGALLLDSTCWPRVSHLAPADFYRPDHYTIFAAMVAAVSVSRTFDVISLADALEQRGQLKDVGGLAYLGELARNTPGTSNLESYARILSEKAALRRLKGIGAQVTKALVERKSSTQIRAALLESLQSAAGDDPPGANTDCAVLARGDSIKPEAISWLWPNWIAAGKLHILAGSPGTGKTTLALGLAAAVTCGGVWPDRTRAAIGDVVLWSGEDSPEDVLIPRALAMGAEVSRLHIVQGVSGPDGRRPYDPAHDTAALANAMRELPAVRLLIVDPIVSAVAGDSHHNAETRRGLQPLVDLAQAHGCALVGITHLSKGSTGRDPVERVTGSLAFGALARVVMMAAREQAEDDKPGRRLLLRAKSNIGPDTGGFAYDLIQEDLQGHPGVVASSVRWGDAVDGTARELMGQAEQVEDDTTDDAKEFLRNLLVDGPSPAKQIFAEATQAGYSRDQMYRAKKKLGVTARKIGMAGGWQWCLAPEDGGGGAEDREDGAFQRGATFTTFGGKFAIFGG